MAMKKKVNQILKPLEINPTQYYLGTGLHTLGLLGWILEQTGRADVYVSTFSTSDAFLSGFHRLRKRGLINNASLVADLKASKRLYSCIELCRIVLIMSIWRRTTLKLFLCRMTSIRFL